MTPGGAQEDRDGVRLELHDRVMLPSGQTARVRGFAPEEGRLLLEYEGALVREHASITLPGRLVRRMLPGERAPQPVRALGVRA